MRNKTTLADDTDAELIYRLRNDLEDLKNRMVETIRVITLGDDGVRTELVLTAVGDVTSRPARLTAAEQRERRAQRALNHPDQLLLPTLDDLIATDTGF